MRLNWMNLSKPTEICLQSPTPEALNMRCLWKLIPWAKRRKLHDEEDHSLLTGNTILQLWELTQRNELPKNSSQSNLQERYVRVGIGGAGNLRKSCSLSGSDQTVDLQRPRVTIADLAIGLGLCLVTAELFRRLRVDVWTRNWMGKMGSSWRRTKPNHDEWEAVKSRIALIEIYGLCSMLSRVSLVKATNASHHPRFVSENIISDQLENSQIMLSYIV